MNPTYLHLDITQVSDEDDTLIVVITSVDDTPSEDGTSLLLADTWEDAVAFLVTGNEMCVAWTRDAICVPEGIVLAVSTNKPSVCVYALAQVTDLLSEGLQVIVPAEPVPGASDGEA